MTDRINYWKELSDYDIETADAMHKSKRYLYVGFMSHQSVEKILKAYFVKITGESAPFSHSLSYIAKKAKIYEHFTEDQKSFLDMLEPMNIECRYPTQKDQLLKSLTEERCREILDKSKELQLWIKQKLY
ncbi:MAG: HEPN domain-containing protein [Desulfococcaceae bacterium]|jgi:HEPN domain-containing protein|nr:HEPN domain-containing protein [Desulfococcaceae bacterium]